MTRDYSADYDRPDMPESHVLCPTCNGNQVVPCRCGGDLCVCESYGETYCPLCGGEYGGEGYVSKEVYDEWWQRQKEWQDAFAVATAEK